MKLTRWKPNTVAALILMKDGRLREVISIDETDGTVEMFRTYASTLPNLESVRNAMIGIFAYLENLTASK